MGTVRRHIRIACPADDVYAVIGEPTTIAEWFPGMVSAVVDGTTRTITSETGLPIPEEIVTNDAIQRRFQYRITAPMFQGHLASVDVFDLGDGTSLVSYATDCEPDVMALIIGGATGGALEELRRQLEAGEWPPERLPRRLAFADYVPVDHTAIPTEQGADS